MVLRCPSLQTQDVLMQEIVEYDFCASTSPYSLRICDSRSKSGTHPVSCSVSSSFIAYWHSCVAFQGGQLKADSMKGTGIRCLIDCSTNFCTTL